MSEYKSDRFYLSKELVKSKAFKSLTKTSTTVYFNFRLRCEVQRPQGKRGREKEWPITNNGKLVYTYDQAEREGISRKSFARALDQLIESGFIDITYHGSGTRGDKSLYAISDRWKKSGQNDFVKKKRPSDKREGHGFTNKKNRYQRPPKKMKS